MMSLFIKKLQKSLVDSFTQTLNGAIGIISDKYEDEHCDDSNKLTLKRLSGPPPHKKTHTKKKKAIWSSFRAFIFQTKVFISGYE